VSHHIFFGIFLGFKLLIWSAWRTFDSEFEDILGIISHHTALLRDEITLAYRQKLHARLLEGLPRTNCSKDVDHEYKVCFETFGNAPQVHESPTSRYLIRWALIESE
jgi:hypothetical protein